MGVGLFRDKAVGSKVCRAWFRVFRAFWVQGLGLRAQGRRSVCRLKDLDQVDPKGTCRAGG